MSSYNPNIPQGSDIISKSQPQIKGNFSSSNDVFAIDHYAFSEADSAKSGHHKKVIYPEGLTTDPNLAKGAGASLYTKKIGDLLELFFQNDSLATAVLQLTGLSVTETSSVGYTLYTMKTPWNLVIFFGFTQNTSGTMSVPLPIKLSSKRAAVSSPNSNFVTGNSYWGCEFSDSVSTTTLKVVNSGVTRSFFFIAMGVPA